MSTMVNALLAVRQRAICSAPASPPIPTAPLPHPSPPLPTHTRSHTCNHTRTQTRTPHLGDASNTVGVAVNARHAVCVVRRLRRYGGARMAVRHVCWAHDVFDFLALRDIGYCVVVGGDLTVKEGDRVTAARLAEIVHCAAAKVGWEGAMVGGH